MNSLAFLQSPPQVGSILQTITVAKENYRHRELGEGSCRDEFRRVIETEFIGDSLAFFRPLTLYRQRM
jgi:hypothetical protein